MTLVLEDNKCKETWLLVSQKLITKVLDDSQKVTFFPITIYAPYILFHLHQPLLP